MKTRFFYVSNSSSSSFIIGCDGAFSKISGSEIMEALVFLYNNYQKEVDEYKKFCEDEKIDEDDYSPIHVYDLSNDEERERGRRRYGNMLSDWIASCSLKDNDGHINPSMDAYERQREWEKFTNRMEDKQYAGGYMLSLSDLTLDVFLEENNKEGSLYKYDRKCDKFFHKPASKRTVRMISDKWKSLGLVSNLDVLMDEKARYFIHFDDNDIYQIKGMTDENSSFSTESWTSERFIEILTIELIRRGYLPEDYDFNKIMERIMTCNMHEG